MNYRENYEKWLNSKEVDEKTKEELKSVTDEKEIEDRFCSMLGFGTAGLRGILGAGLNRMNVYTVRYATQGLAKLIKDEGAEACEKGVAVACDSRHMSREFSEEVCSVLAANGIKTFLFDGPRPTPEMSFAIRQLGCSAGVNITASHNPKEYNGYKAYWSDGIQLSPEQAKIVSDTIGQIDIFDDVKTVPFEDAKKYITVLGEDFDDIYLGRVLEQNIDRDAIAENADMKIVYTPLHGAGHRLVPEALRRAGFRNVLPVAAQTVLDGDFPTVKSPNPENAEALTLAVEYAKQIGADLVIGTDPDCDRVGIATRRADGEFVLLSGNRTGAVLLDYVINARRRNGTLPANACAVKTIVTSEIATRICKANGVAIENVLTGFKYIGEKLQHYIDSGEHTFIMGYEESYGYLFGDYARDKDGVVASLMIAEAAAYYRSRGMTVYDALMSVFGRYGFSVEKTLNLVMSGFDGAEKMKKMMEALRADPPKQIGGVRVTEIKDYSGGLDGLPKANVLSYSLEDGSTLIVRPSGTEPKVKVYIMTDGRDEDEANTKEVRLENGFKEAYPC